MRRALAAAFIVAFLQCCGSAAMALGFGSVTNATRLGQPLDFTVAVKLDGDESLQPACVSADVTAGDTRIPPAQVHTRLVRNGRASDALVRISTTSRVREPVVTVVLSLGCPPRVAHKFVSLLDPAPAAPRGEPIAKTALAAAPPVPAPAPVPVAAPAPAAEAPGTVAGTDTGERMQDAEKLQALQDSVERLRQEQQALQQSVTALQAKLRETQEARHDPALYGLATLVVLLLVVVITLLLRDRRHRSDQAWMREARSLAAGPRAGDARPAPPPATPRHDEVTMTSMRVVPDSTFAAPATMPPQSVTAGQGATVPEAARVRRELTTDELIDLEQQADFFIALGQEESAIDLLMGHVRSSGGTSPMPYLKLLEIYRKRGEAEAYERIRERFNRRFNVHAADWDSDPAQSRPLSDYPDIVERLQRAWPAPARAIDLLEALLFRRDPLQAGFDLPAYEELLFLYALAKDMVDTESNPDGVDLLLPLEMGEAAPAITHVAHASPPSEPKEPRAGKPVDVDLDLGNPGPSPAPG
jgi:hypothetical protein